MSDDKTDENPFSFMHFVKNKKEGLDDPDVDNKSGSRPQQPRSDEVNVNELPFPEVGETGVKKRTKGINIYCTISRNSLLIKIYDRN
jgi:hypothetical protein